MGKLSCQDCGGMVVETADPREDVVIKILPNSDYSEIRCGCGHRVLYSDRIIKISAVNGIVISIFTNLTNVQI